MKTRNTNKYMKIWTNQLATSNISHSSLAAGTAAGKATERKLQKYTELSACYTFVPVAFETLGPVNSLGAEFIRSIGIRARGSSGDVREGCFLWQRLSMAIQRFNAVCIQGTFETLKDGSLDDWSYISSHHPRAIYTRGILKKLKIKIKMNKIIIIIA